MNVPIESLGFSPLSRATQQLDLQCAICARIRTEAIYFGNASWQNNTGFGDGPWVAADLENGMYYGGNVSAPTNKPMTHEFVTALLKGRTDSMALLGADATAGA